MTTMRSVLRAVFTALLRVAKWLAAPGAGPKLLAG